MSELISLMDFDNRIVLFLYESLYLLFSHARTCFQVVR